MPKHYTQVDVEGAMEILRGQVIRLFVGFAIAIVLAVPLIQHELFIKHGVVPIRNVADFVDAAYVRIGSRIVSAFFNRSLSASGSGGNNSAARTMSARRNTLQSLPTGKIVLVAPQSTRVKEETIVQANVGKNLSIQQLKTVVPNKGQSQVFETNVRVSTEMSATLDGTKFTIVAKDPETQSIADDYPAVWRWAVTASEPGLHQLTATLYANIPDKGRLTKVRIDSYTQNIDVLVKEVGWLEWISSIAPNFEAVKTIVVAIAAIAAAASGLIAFILNRKRRAKASVDDTDGVIAT